MKVRSKATVWIALALILIGIALPSSYARWLNTRTFLALKMPVSLKPGEITSPDFKVNLAGSYQIGTDVDQSFPFRFDCGFGGKPPLLKTRIRIHQDGQLVSQSDGADRFLGHFYAEKGRRYRLDIQILTDAGCLNGGHPRIFVWTPSAGYDALFDQLLAVSVVLVLSALGVGAFSTTVLTQERTNAQVQVSIVEKAESRWLALLPRLSRMPSFGLVYSVILGGILIPTILIYLYAWGYNHRSMGIEVHLVKPGAPTRRTPIDFRSETLVVRVESLSVHSRPNLYLNSQAIAWGDLGPDLKTELKTRAEWLVYVEADSDAKWEDVVDAMEIIRSAGAKVVCLTTETTRPIR